MRTYSERFSVYLLNGKFNPNLNKSMVRVRETNMTLDCCPTFRRKVTPDYVARWMDIIIQTRKHTHTKQTRPLEGFRPKNEQSQLNTKKIYKYICYQCRHEVMDTYICICPYVGLAW